MLKMVIVFCGLLCMLSGCMAVRAPALAVLAADNTPLPGHARMARYSLIPLAIASVEATFEVEGHPLDEIARFIKDGLVRRGWREAPWPDNLKMGSPEGIAQRNYRFQREVLGNPEAEVLEVGLWDKKDGTGPVRATFSFDTNYSWEEPNRQVFKFVTGAWYSALGLPPAVAWPTMFVTALPVGVLAYSL
jgi:hypothetical protein